ncbi:hypothetical protein [Microcoleus sp. B4-D4]
MWHFPAMLRLNRCFPTAGFVQYLKSFTADILEVELLKQLVDKSIF